LIAEVELMRGAVLKEEAWRRAREANRDAMLGAPYHAAVITDRLAARTVIALPIASGQ
jgi:hypothetical protein